MMGSLAMVLCFAIAASINVERDVALRGHGAKYRAMQAALGTGPSTSAGAAGDSSSWGLQPDGGGHHGERLQLLGNGDPALGRPLELVAI